MKYIFNTRELHRLEYIVKLITDTLYINICVYRLHNSIENYTLQNNDMRYIFRRVFRSDKLDLAITIT